MSLRRRARRVLRVIKQRVAPADLGFMDWRTLIARDRDVWQRARDRANGPHVLLGTTIGRFKWEVNFDSTLAVALTLRGARVSILVCDQQLPACSAWVRHGVPAEFSPTRHSPRKTLCGGCLPPTLDVLEPLGLQIQRYGDLVHESELDVALAPLADLDLAGIRKLVIDDIEVGEHAVAGAIRFFACARLEDESDHLDVTRRYLRAAIIAMLAARKAMTSRAVEVICGSHGIYVPQGLVSEVARKLDVRVVNWHQAYRQQCVLFSHGDTYHKTLLHEPASEWVPAEWTPEMAREIVEYLDSRQFGKQDWISFNRTPDARSIDALRQMGIDFEKPCIGVLTNVAWDAQLHYGPSPFDDMMTWLTETIRYFVARPELQVIIRIHPAEVKGYNPSRQPALGEIKRVFPQLPANIFVIPPESTISTYETMERCNAVIIYATKTGIELSARGVPIIAAGEAWIKNKGFALDPRSRQDYFDLLDRLPMSHKLDDEQRLLALKYAYHFFLRRMIPVSYLDEKMRPNVRSLADLMPGRDRGMDVICDGILNQTSFVYRR